MFEEGDMENSILLTVSNKQLQQPTSVPLHFPSWMLRVMQKEEEKNILYLYNKTVSLC